MTDNREKLIMVLTEGLREFGYPDLSRKEVEEALDAFDDDAIDDKNVIHMLVKGLIQDAQDD